MGAPIGNRNAAGPHKGWYKASKAQKHLFKQMNAAIRKRLRYERLRPMWARGSHWVDPGR